LELACLQELSLRDVADRLRVSLGCARHYYYRGLRRLRAWAQLAEGSRPQREEPGRHRSPARTRVEESDVRRGARETDAWTRRTASGDAGARHDDARHDARHDDARHDDIVSLE
jgi:hypothetical protein